MSEHQTPAPQVLMGLGQIAAYFGVHRRTVRRWIVTRPDFPAVRLRSGTWASDCDLLAQWEEQQHTADLAPLDALRKAAR